jgi:cell volume regulation protein A
VFASLAASRMRLGEKLVVSWVGLRGAAPIVLATFALLAGTPKADFIFNIVFFVVITSVLLQGTTIAAVARWLHADAPLAKKRRSPIEFEHTENVTAELVEFIIPFNAAVAGKAIFELRLPADSLITLICRDEKFTVATGRTILQEGDVVMALASPENVKTVQAILSKQKG